MWSVCSNWSAGYYSRAATITFKVWQEGALGLLFEGSDYNIQGLAGGGYYSRAVSDRGNMVCRFAGSICFAGRLIT